MFVLLYNPGNFEESYESLKWQIWKYELGWFWLRQSHNAVVIHLYTFIKGLLCIWTAKRKWLATWIYL